MTADLIPDATILPVFWRNGSRQCFVALTGDEVRHKLCCSAYEIRSVMSSLTQRKIAVVIRPADASIPTYHLTPYGEQEARRLMILANEAKRRVASPPEGHKGFSRGNAAQNTGGAL